MRPVIAIVGPTASGKTALAIELAQRVGGEIVSADSRQVYRGMDIGTAKPTATEREAIPHWLIDVVDPNEDFSLARFLDLAHDAIADITRRGKPVIVAGGTGQFVWALLEGWRVPRVPPNPALRAELEALAANDGADAVLSRLREVDPAIVESIDPRNTRRVIRAIEVTLATGTPFSAWQIKEPAFESCIVGLSIDRSELYRRIDARVDTMIQSGLIDEARRLIAAGYGCSLPAMASIGYREACEHIAGRLSADEATARIKTETHRLARMQHTWFRRDDPRISWLDASSSTLVSAAVAVVDASLSGTDAGRYPEPTHGLHEDSRHRQ